MKLGCYILCFIFFTGNCIVNAQTRSLDSLPQALTNTKTIRQRIDVLNDFADTLCLHKKDTGRVLALTALQLSRVDKYHIGMGDASHSLGLIKFRRDNDSAIFYFKQARAAYLHQYPGFEKMAFVLNNISRTYHELLQFDSSLYWARQALHFVQHTREQEVLTNRWFMFIYGALANAHAGESRYDSANFYYLKAIASAEQLNDNKMLEVYFKGVAGIQAQLGNYEKAIAFGNKAIQYLQDDDRALTIILANMGSYYNKMKDYTNAERMADSSLAAGRRSNTTNVVGRNYATLGTGKMEQKNYTAALAYFKTGLQYATQLKNSKSSISLLQRKLGEAYEVLDSLPQAKENYTSALQTAEGDKEVVSNIYFSLSKLAYKEGNYNSAYQYLQQYHQFHDSVYTGEKVKVIQELNTRYETEKKDQQLLLLSKDKELQQAVLFRHLQQIEKDNAKKREQQLVIDNFKLGTEKQEQLLQIQQLDIENNRIKQQEQQAQLTSSRNKLEVEKKQKELNATTIKSQRNWLMFLLSAFIIAAFITVLLFNRYKLMEKIQNQQSLMEQRQRISRDLHDEVGATLSGIAMYSHLIKGQLQSNNINAAENSLQVMQQSSRQMADKLNDIVWLINPEKDSLQQLISRLEDYAIKMAVVKDIKVNIKIPDKISDNVLHAEIRRNIYLFCKEAINNAVKYSNAATLDFSVTKAENVLQIMVTDNGVGFDISKSSGGNGLANMKNRAVAIKGQMEVVTSKENGTCVKLLMKITP